MALGLILMTFGGLETGLKLHDFGWLSGGDPELRAHRRVVVIGLSLGPIASTKQFGGSLQHAKYSIKLSGIKGYEKNRMQITKMRKIKAAI